jgi:hypothetical protein
MVSQTKQMSANPCQKVSVHGSLIHGSARGHS